MCSKSLYCISKHIIFPALRPSTPQASEQNYKSTSRKQQWCITALESSKFSCITCKHQFLAPGWSGIMRDPVGASQQRHPGCSVWAGFNLHDKHHHSDIVLGDPNEITKAPLLCGGPVQAFYTFEKVARTFVQYFCSLTVADLSYNYCREVALSPLI